MVRTIGGTETVHALRQIRRDPIGFLLRVHLLHINVSQCIDTCNPREGRQSRRVSTVVVRRIGEVGEANDLVDGLLCPADDRVEL